MAISKQIWPLGGRGFLFHFRYANVQNFVFFMGNTNSMSHFQTRVSEFTWLSVFHTLLQIYKKYVCAVISALSMRSYFITSRNIDSVHCWYQFAQPTPHKIYLCNFTLSIGLSTTPSVTLVWICVKYVGFWKNMLSILD